MIDCRRDIDLPYVVDSEEAVVEKLSAMVLALVGFEIPGVGIQHTGNGGHEDTHFAHRTLVTEAITLAGDVLAVNESFDKAQLVEFGSGTRMHADLLGLGMINERGSMILRLHTAEEHNGAIVMLANSAPGLGGEFDKDIGDIDLFPYHRNPTAEASKRGYQMQRALWPQDLLVAVVEGSYNPLANEGNIYHFIQHPLYSVLFRSSVSFGPVSVHDFKAIDSDAKRYAYNSDLLLASQTL